MAMLRRRYKVAPYELMGPRSAGGKLGGALPTPSRSSGPAEPGDGRWWSWSGAGTPLVLRVPRGLAVVVLAAVVGLIVLGYWVGYARGRAAAETALAPADPDAQRYPAPTLTPAGLESPSEASAQQNPTRPGPLPSARSDAARQAQAGPDPRQPGLNYLILARYPPEAAQRLAEFLEANGIATVQVPVDNGRFVHVVAVDRGFSGDQLGGEAYRQYVGRLRDLG
ncbi:MAG TPA: hypothetical protein VF184_12405, partial [Phycisphaeraceae bacterium]